MSIIVTVVSSFAICASLSGATLMSLGKPKFMPYSAIAYFCGSILWFSYGVMLSLLPLILMNIAFGCIEGRAVYKWFKGDSLIEKPKIVVTAEMQNAMAEYKEHSEEATDYYGTYVG